MFQMEHSAQNGSNLTIDNQRLMLKTGSENLKPNSWEHFGTFLEKQNSLVWRVLPFRGSGETKIPGTIWNIFRRLSQRKEKCPK